MTVTCLASMISSSLSRRSEEWPLSLDTAHSGQIMIIYHQYCLSRLSGSQYLPLGRLLYMTDAMESWTLCDCASDSYCSD